MTMFLIVLFAHLGRDNEVILFPAKLLNCLTQYDFGLSTRVDLGSVEEVDTGIVCSLDAVKCSFLSTTN